MPLQLPWIFNFFFTDRDNVFVANHWIKQLLSEVKVCEHKLEKKMPSGSLMNQPGSSHFGFQASQY